LFELLRVLASLFNPELHTPVSVIIRSSGKEPEKSITDMEGVIKSMKQSFEAYASMNGVIPQWPAATGQ
jgi:hypothetical protein